MSDRFYVYVLISEKDPMKYYIGMTTDIEGRVRQHNEFKCAYSKRFAPWRLETYIFFHREDLALAFERYLKHGSGHAFLKRHLI